MALWVRWRSAAALVKLPKRAADSNDWSEASEGKVRGGIGRADVNANCGAINSLCNMRTMN
jgi:hypothetical protein